MSGCKNQTDGPRVQRGVLCAKCEHLNPPGLSTCEFCNAHLHLLCSYCRQRNARVQSCCSQCGRSLHRSFWSRGWQALFGRERKMHLVQAILLALAILAGLALIIFFSEFRLPKP
jgi:hypothetical protein